MQLFACCVPDRPRSPSLSPSPSLLPSLLPSGTGKTTTLVAYLLALCAARGTGRVLVCAPSNRGVQEVCERFLGAQQTVAAEDEAILIGDADKVPSDAPCRRVFVFALAERWGGQLEATAQAVPERLVSTALCSKEDCQSLVRVRHCEACAAQAEHVKTALGSTRAALGAIGASIRRRHPHSWRSHGLQRVFEVAGSAATAAAALLDEVSAAWPCQLRCRSDELHERLKDVRKSVLESANLVSETLRDADAHAEALASARIVFATLCVAGSYLVRGMPPVSHLVVDEAAQATEPEALIPLLCQPRRMLLIGDPCQLCCMCVSARARAAGLERSLMARLLDARAAPLHFLSTQYRMHPSIAAFPSRQFYQGKLIDAPCTASLANTAAWVRRTGTPNGAPHLGPCTPRHSHLGPWALVDVADGAERQRADGSIYNADEAAVVVALVRELHDEWNLEVRSIRALRVLTFYAAQVGEISRALAAAGLRGVVVGTVDGSQGSEADVILLSCVRSNAGARLGFVTDSLLECMLIANLIRCAARLRHRLALMTTDWLPHQVRGSASSLTGGGSMWRSRGRSKRASSSRMQPRSVGRRPGMPPQTSFAPQARRVSSILPTASRRRCGWLQTPPGGTHQQVRAWHTATALPWRHRLKRRRQPLQRPVRRRCSQSEH